MTKVFLKDSAKRLFKGREKLHRKIYLKLGKNWFFFKSFGKALSDVIPDARNKRIKA